MKENEEMKKIDFSVFVESVTDRLIDPVSL
jgi:hypothetical protein